MGRASRAHRIATLAAYGGGGIGVAGALAAALLMGEVELAKRTIRPTGTSPPHCGGRYGGHEPGADIVMALLGDSSAAGYGVATAAQTPGALLATGTAGHLHRPVDLRCLAVVGARSPDLEAQVERALAVRPDIAVILIGGNDVTHLTKVPVAVRYLGDAVRRLRGAGAEVVVGTCPDLGTIRPLQPPLRWLARNASRSLAAAQTIAVVEAGGRTVSLGDLLGPHFALAPERMFSPDRFHPSAEGYRTAVEAMLPTVVDALAGAAVRPLVPAAAMPAGVRRGPTAGEGVRSLAHAAVEAVERPGTEVSGARVAGQDRGPTGRWAQLRRRVRLGLPRPGGPADPEPAVPLREDPPATVERT